MDIKLPFSFQNVYIKIPLINFDILAEIKIPEIYFPWTYLKFTRSIFCSLR